MNSPKEPVATLPKGEHKPAPTDEPIAASRRAAQTAPAANPRE
jgi:hypothetical protein